MVAGATIARSVDPPALRAAPEGDVLSACLNNEIFLANEIARDTTDWRCPKGTSVACGMHLAT